MGAFKQFKLAVGKFSLKIQPARAPNISYLWLTSISVVTLHIPFTALWAWLTGQPDPLAVAAWQMVAWPLLAGVALVTIGPVLRLLPERLLLSRRGAWMGLGLGAMASAGASFVLMNRATASP